MEKKRRGAMLDLVRMSILAREHLTHRKQSAPYLLGVNVRPKSDAMIMATSSHNPLALVCFTNISRP
jgi:hypothetical protein